jgi:hypothetical protein
MKCSKMDFDWHAARYVTESIIARTVLTEIKNKK